MLPDVVHSRRLVYNTIKHRICQYLFSLFSEFFSRINPAGFYRIRNRFVHRLTTRSEGVVWQWTKGHFSSQNTQEMPLLQRDQARRLHMGRDNAVNAHATREQIYPHSTREHIA